MGARRTLGVGVVAVGLLLSSGPARAQTEKKKSRAGVRVLAIGIPAGLGGGLASLGFYAVCEQSRSLHSAFGGDSSKNKCTPMLYLTGLSFGAAAISVLVGTLMITAGGRKPEPARKSGVIPRLEASVAPGGGQLTATWAF